VDYGIFKIYPENPKIPKILIQTKIKNKNIMTKKTNVWSYKSFKIKYTKSEATK